MMFILETLEMTYTQPLVSNIFSKEMLNAGPFTGEGVARTIGVRAHSKSQNQVQVALSYNM